MTFPSPRALICELRLLADDDNADGSFVRDWPVDHGFYDTPRRLGIRQRVFYCTRDTSISWQLTQGANPWGVAKYHGTSLQMIERHYGKYIPDRGLDPAIIEALERQSGNQERTVSDDEAKVATRRNRNLSDQKAKVSYKSAKILVRIKCEEGDLNPERDFSGDKSHSSDSPAEPKGSAQPAARFRDPDPTQLSLNFTPKTGTVPVVETRRGGRDRRT